ncbi:epidermal growth factor-like protein 7 isoform X1 [Hippocampus zosterae]|uniref:epidermal growth factor-like protein 7 isoform X1 n=1 Tax=Hippocampus zosterae TaxID=109293 RepID=UPI00223CC3DA|nr:epidermal growth factor-like protein 7 isoform X1 [Hippocampus zosterae]
MACVCTGGPPVGGAHSDPPSASPALLRSGCPCSEERERRRARERHGERRGKESEMMRATFLATLLVLHAAAEPSSDAHDHRGRRACVGREPRRHPRVVTATESYVLPLHKPFLTLCQGRRLCSTYKTTYALAYRQVSRVAPFSNFYPECCPGWRRFHSLHCNRDVDECVELHPCAHGCVNTVGSFRCTCRRGYVLGGDARSCRRLGAPASASTRAPPTGATPGNAPDNVTAQMHNLRSRVELLEKKLQVALAPYGSVFPEEVASEESATLLSHSFRQLDRIDSLSEQIGFLEERLGTCSCQEKTRRNRN